VHAIKSYWLTRGEFLSIGLGLWFLTLLSTIFQLYRGGQFYWCMKPEYPDLSQVNDEFYPMMFYREHVLEFVL
jgi:hypothetical protein